MSSAASAAGVVPPQTMVKPGARLASLDVVRGMTIAFMILVNNNGSARFAYWPLKHSEWSGWTPTDLVFPSFLFMAGVSIVFSVDSRLAKGENRRALFLHAVKRSIILFLLGLVVNGFPFFHLATLRIYGVLQRIAVCFLVASVIYLWNRRWWVSAGIAVAALLGYWILMRWVPIPGVGVPTHAVPLLDPNQNWVAHVDRELLPGRLYERVRDPEGLLSDIPAVGTILLGVLTGMWLKRPGERTRKASGLLAASICLLVLGKVWNIWFPINKKLWTSSFVLFTAGCTLALLFLCFLFIEIKKWNGAWTYPWRVFGSNAITAYMISELLSGALGNIPMHHAGRTIGLQQYLYWNFFQYVVNPPFGSLVYSLLFVLVCFVPLAVLYSRKIYIKV